MTLEGGNQGQGFVVDKARMHCCSVVLKKKKNNFKKY